MPVSRLWIHWGSVVLAACSCLSGISAVDRPVRWSEHATCFHVTKGCCARRYGSEAFYPNNSVMNWPSYKWVNPLGITDWKCAHHPLEDILSSFKPMLDICANCFFLVISGGCFDTLIHVQHNLMFVTRKVTRQSIEQPVRGCTQVWDAN